MNELLISYKSKYNGWAGWGVLLPGLIEVKLSFLTKTFPYHVYRKRRFFKNYYTGIKLTTLTLKKKKSKNSENSIKKPIQRSPQSILCSLYSNCSFEYMALLVSFQLFFYLILKLVDVIIKITPYLLKFFWQALRCNCTWKWNIFLLFKSSEL